LASAITNSEGDDMKNIGKLLAGSAILGFLALIAIPVGAIAAGDALCPKFLAGMGPGDGERLTAHLDQLESLGYDVSDIRAAVESGDYETAHTLVQQFMEEHKDELPAPPAGERTGEGKTPPPRASISGERPGTGVLKDRTTMNG
jgi:hypothetical protein